MLSQSAEVRLNVRLSQFTTLAGKAGASLPYLGFWQFSVKPCPSDDYLHWHREFVDCGEGHRVRKRTEKFRLMPMGDDVTAHVYQGHAVSTDRLDQLGYLLAQSADSAAGIEQDKTRSGATRKQSERGLPFREAGARRNFPVSFCYLAQPGEVSGHARTRPGVEDVTIPREPRHNGLAILCLSESVANE